MDPKHLQGLMEAYQQVNAPQEEIEEASYSAKAARAGKDIGKPGKAFSKIAASAAKRYGSEERGKKVAGAVLAKLRKEEIEIIEDVLGEAVKGESSERRSDLAAERKAGHRPLSPAKGRDNANKMQRDINYFDKLTKKNNNEEVEIFDTVLEFLQVEGYAETLEEAEWLMANVIDEKAIAIVIGEAQEARNNPEKYEAGQQKKYAPVRGEKTPMPPRGDKRREDFEKWYAANGPK